MKALDQSRDTDCYDPQYSHLLLLDEDGKSIAGSYRARVVHPGKTPASAPKRLTRPHFLTTSRTLPLRGNAPELGRAFVCPE